MCGIVGYIGWREAYPFLLSGLQHVEYRGYDSAGICTRHNGELLVHKKAGRMSNLTTRQLPGTLGI